MARVALQGAVSNHPFQIRSRKLQNESFPNFSNFRPEFCPEFSPNFSRIFRASFRGRRRPEKIHQKSPPFFNAKFPGKHEKNIHRILLESRQSNFQITINSLPVCAAGNLEAQFGNHGLQTPLSGANSMAATPPVTATPSIRAKKDTQTQRFHPKIPCLNPPFLGAFNPRNSLCSGCVFPSKCRKNANTKNFEGGRGGQEKKTLC